MNEQSRLVITFELMIQAGIPFDELFDIVLSPSYQYNDRIHMLAAIVEHVYAGTVNLGGRKKKDVKKAVLSLLRELFHDEAVKCGARIRRDDQTTV